MQLQTLTLVGVFAFQVTETGAKCQTCPCLYSGFKSFQADTLSFPGDIKIFNYPPRKVVYIIDGIRHDEATAFNAISPLDIESIKVLKDDSPETKQYGENVSVIKIQTKKGKNNLIELIKGLPGVKIEADGSITVNGLAVKKIMINGRTYSVDTEK